MKPVDRKNLSIKSVGKEFYKDDLLYVLKMMLTARSVDNKAMNLLRAG